jgi:3-hydroxybutyryl-CoA dehydrogenase
MSVDIQSPSLCLGIVGTGAMGRGIAQIAAQAGIRVLLFDALHGAAANARETVVGTLAKLADKGRISADALAAATARLEVVRNLDELASAQVIVEAIVENLDVKKQLFQQLEDIIGADCILATNTSSLSVTSIAAACKRPERVAGFHFFNPVPLMKIVEVIDGLLTAPWAADALLALGGRMGHTAVRAKDTPGFIVNHAGRGFVTEALRVLGEGIADFREVDCIMREAAGFRMGPFELMDLTGLDVSQPVMESIYHQYYQEARYRPSPIAAQRLTGGLLGRKTGRGFYDYADGKAVAIPGWPGLPPCPAASGSARPIRNGPTGCATSPPPPASRSNPTTCRAAMHCASSPRSAPTSPPVASSRGSTRSAPSASTACSAPRPARARGAA